MATLATFDDVICIAPQYEGQQTRVEKIIAIACLSIDPDIWGDKTAHATALLTAHMLTVYDRLGVGGEIKRQKLGDTEVEYGIQTGENMHEYATTSYGKLFLALRKTLVITPLVSGC